MYSDDMQTLVQSWNVSQDDQLLCGGSWIMFVEEPPAAGAAAPLLSF